MSAARWLVALLWWLLAVPAGAAVHEFGDEGEAYAACMAGLAHAQATPITVGTQVYEWVSAAAGGDCAEVGGSSTRWRRCEGRYKSMSTGTIIGRGCTVQTDNWDRYEWPESATCEARELQVGGWAVDDDPTTVEDRCYKGCYYEHWLDAGELGDPNPTPLDVWGVTGEVCTSGDAPTPVPDRDGDGVPDDEDAFPDDPSESSDSDGDGVGDNADHAPEDETDGADDGEGNESDNRASGGGTCDRPPSCTGDGIACATLYQQWRTRCAVEGHGQRLENTSCAGGLELRCTGMSIAQCYELAQAKKAACALEALAAGDGSSGPGGGDDGGDGGDPPVDPGEDPENAYRGSVQLGLDRLDDGGLWSSRTCPTLPPIPLGRFGVFDPNEAGWICDLATLVRGAMILVGGFIALRLLMGG